MKLIFVTIILYLLNFWPVLFFVSSLNKWPKIDGDLWWSYVRSGWCEIKNSKNLYRLIPETTKHKQAIHCHHVFSSDEYLFITISDQIKVERALAELQIYN